MYKNNSNTEEIEKLLAKVAEKLQISEAKVLAKVSHPLIAASANDAEILREYLNKILIAPETINEVSEIKTMGADYISETE